jgi:ADP-ribose pyrophosphatase YjhB (NUDIX family)
LASPSWRSVLQHGPPGTAVVEEEASMVVVVSAVAVVSMGEVSVVESAAAAVESALAEHTSALVEHTSQVAVGTLPAEDPGFLHMGILHLGSPTMMDELADP